VPPYSRNQRLVSPARETFSTARQRSAQGLIWGDFVEKVEKSSVTKTRQIAIRWNIAAQHHRRPVEDLARCPIDKLAGPPADFLNAAPIGLPENRTSPKGSFSTKSGMGGRRY
jgi:hypothetical protein